MKTRLIPHFWRSVFFLVPWIVVLSFPVRAGCEDLYGELMRAIGSSNTEDVKALLEGGPTQIIGHAAIFLHWEWRRTRHLIVQSPWISYKSS